MILEVDPEGLVALEDGQTVDGLVDAGYARLLAEFVNGRVRLATEEMALELDGL